MSSMDVGDDPEPAPGPRRDSYGTGRTACLCRVGPYRVLGILGSGATAEVYRAVNEQTGRLVALKTIRIPSEARLPVVRREITSLARLRHPGIVRILDSGAEDGLPWYAMELIDGVSLRRYCGASWDPTATPPRLSLSPVLEVFYHLCVTLAYLHGQGIIHRDLKPENVLVQKSGTPVLVDFGLAEEFSGRGGRESLQECSIPAGTLRYMAPEQLRGDLLDARADLYSLGCMLFEILAGRPVFVADTAAELIRAQLRDHPPDLREHAAAAPAELHALVRHLLEKKRQDRLGYADDVAAELAKLGARRAADRRIYHTRPYLYRPGFVGRGEALAVIIRQLASLQGGHGDLVLVSGESGVGKTRLCVEVARQAERRGIRVLTGGGTPRRAFATGGDAPIRVPLEALRRPLQLMADRCRERGPEEAARLFGRRGKLLARYEPSLASLDGLDMYGDPVELPPEAALFRLHAYLAETLAAYAVERSVLLLLDDLHWADELSLGFLVHLLGAQFLKTHRILVLGTYRRGDSFEALRSLTGRDDVVTVDLDRLDEPGIATMVKDMLAIPTAPPEFVSFLAKHSEGNPLFVAEYLRTAVEVDVLRRDAQGKWHFSERSIATEERGARRVASVAVVELEEIELWLGTLVARDLLEQEDGVRYRFVHDKVRDVAYGRIPERRRRELHAAGAECLEAMLENGEAVPTSTVAQHWEQAGEREKAARYYLAGADSALASYAYAEAEHLFSAYLNLFPVPAVAAVRARNRLAEEVVSVRGRTREAQELHRHALADARQLGDRLGEGLSLRGLGQTSWVLGDSSAAVQLLTESLVIFRAEGERLHEAKALSSLGAANWELGNLGEAAVSYAAALAIYRDQGDRRFEARTLQNLAVIQTDQGHLDEAESLAQAAIEMARAGGDRRAEAVAVGNLALIRRGEQKPEEARRLLEKSLAILRDVSDRQFEGWILLSLAGAQADLGSVGAARALFAEAVDTLRSVGDRHHESEALCQLACLERRAAGDFAAAHHLLDEAERLFLEVKAFFVTVKCWCERGHLALAEGRSAQAEYERALALVHPTQLGEGSEIVAATARLRRAMDAFAVGGPLQFGECLGDVPAALRRAALGSG
ncbi:MAG: protein kinase [Candidatus Schekmanbacteria bacterium]|nr:protein kinase [Candidatus Schekmanbacteria bacterium]